MADTTAVKGKWRTVDLAYTALFAVLMTVCAWISVPLPVPFTLQTFAICAAMGVLGGRRSTWAVAVYLLLGAVGLPVFSGFRGGLGALLGTTGGYILGFLAMPLVYWLVTDLLGDRLAVSATAMVLGLAVCYAFGTAWFVVLYTRSSGPITVGAALGMCVLPFVIPDLVKMGLALALSRRLRDRLK